MLVVLSLLDAVYEGILFWHDVEPDRDVLSLYSFIFLLVLVHWVDADSKDRSRIYRPFEYGQLVLMLWLPYLPYYFWSTRRSAGLLMLMGVAALFYMGYLVQWVLYAAL